MDNSAIDALMRPNSVAIIGASATPGKIGYTVVKNLLNSKYQGEIYPINPKDKEILGLKCYPSVLDVPGEIDAAVMTVPAKFVAQITEECGKKGVKGLIAIASGFSESGRKDLEDEMLEIAGRYGVRVLGPNIVGTLSNSDQLNASFAPFLPYNGKAALISQSGALLIAIDAISYSRGVGFDKLISIGNMSDVDFADIIDWLNLRHPLHRRSKRWTSFPRIGPALYETHYRIKIWRFIPWRCCSCFAHRFISRRCKGVWRCIPARWGHPCHRP